MLSLETHWRVNAIAEEKLHLPAGYDFSNGGEEASRICLHNLRALLLSSTESSELRVESSIPRGRREKSCD
ncbi:MAG: hypothetical protein ACREF9_09325 [Opitutaceae bacterium]